MPLVWSGFIWLMNVLVKTAARAGHTLMLGVSQLPTANSSGDD